MPRQLPNYAIMPRQLYIRVAREIKQAAAMLAADRGDPRREAMARQLADTVQVLGDVWLAHDEHEQAVAMPYLEEIARLRAERDDLRDRLDAIRSVLEEVSR